MKKLLMILLALAFVVSLPGSATAKDSADRVVIYMVDNLTISDLNPQTTPFLWSLKDKGAMGLLNTVTGGERTVKNACCTISAGKPAVGSNNAHLNFESTEITDFEKAGTIFFRHTGVLPQKENIVVSSIEVIHKNNQNRGLGKPGTLGDAIHSMGYTTAVVGNSDRPGFLFRPGALILMDSKGIVDDGAIGPEMNKWHEPAHQFWENDYLAMVTRSKDLAKHNVILVEFGDLHRLESMYPLFAGSRYIAEREQVLSQIDTAMAQIHPQLASQNSCTYVISPSPSRNSFVPGALLTPLIVVKPDVSGILTSHSTRRQGIVPLTSIKNSILNCLNSSIKDPIYASPHENPYQRLQKLNQRAVFLYTGQPIILPVIIALSLVLLVIALVQILRKKHPHLVNNLLLFLLCFPLSLLLIGPLDIFDRFMFIAVFLGINLIVTLTCWGISRAFNTHLLLPALSLTIITISLDLVLNTGLIAKSIMSYRIISGARYYGLGNEYMGVLIGATISLASLILNKSQSQIRQILIAFLFCTVIFLIAFPLFGVNVGGTITASIAMGYTYCKFRNVPLNIKRVISLLGATIFLLVIMAAIDLNRPFELQSHLGYNLWLIFTQGLDEIVNIIGRKLQMHLRILNYTYLSWILLGAILVLTFLMLKPSRSAKKLSNYIPAIVYKGLQGILIAAVLALISNDSGITAAAALFFYFTGTLLFSLNNHLNRPGLERHG